MEISLGNSAPLGWSLAGKEEQAGGSFGCGQSGHLGTPSVVTADFLPPTQCPTAWRASCTLQNQLKNIVIGESKHFCPSYLISQKRPKKHLFIESLAGPI